MMELPGVEGKNEGHVLPYSYNNFHFAAAITAV